MRALDIAPPSPTARRLAKQAARQVACEFAAQPVAELEHSKPRWAKNATRKGSFAPEMNKAGSRRVPHTPRGHGPRKMWAAS